MKLGSTVGLISIACFAGVAANAQSWSGEMSGPSGGYPRMTQRGDGSLIMGVDAGNAIYAYKSTNGGDSWMPLADGAAAVPDPSGANEKVGNVFPLALPNGDLLIAYRHLNDSDEFEFFNIGIHRSTDGGKTWSHLSDPVNHINSPGGGNDTNGGAWEPFLYQHSPTEIWCLYSWQQNIKTHPLLLKMKRSTDGGATWSAEEIIAGPSQFPDGNNGVAGMSSLVKANNGDLLVVFETASPNGNWFAIRMVRSTDNGVSWSGISTVYDQSGSGVYGAGAPYIAKMDDGMLVVSYQHGVDDANTSGTGRMGYVISTDHGFTWSGNTDLFPAESLWNGAFVDADGTYYGMTSGVKFKKYYPGAVPNYTNEPFRLFAKHTDKVLAVDFVGASPTNGAVVRQQSVQEVDAQKWIRHDEGGGFFSLEPLNALGKRLSVAPAAEQGDFLHIWDAGGDNQQWYVIEEFGYFKIVNKVSGLAIDVWGNDPSDGADAVLWESLGKGNQQFSALMADGSQLNPFTNYVKKPQYKITNKNSGKVVDRSANGMGNGTNLQQWDYNPGQNWGVNQLGNGYFWLEPSAAPGMSFQLDGFSSANGENITLWEYDGHDNKKWSVREADGEGYLKIENKHSGKVAEVASFSTADGGNIQQWESAASNDDSQKWMFGLVSSFAAPARPLLGNIFPNRISLYPGAIGNSQTIYEDEDPAPFTSGKNGLGNGTISYQWQWTTTPGNGGSWVDLAGATNETYTAPNMNGFFTVDTEVFVRRTATDTYYEMDSNMVSLKITVNTFETWMANYALTGADTDRGADPDEDGLDNFVEYALGGNPNVVDASTVSPHFEIVNAGGGRSFVEYIYNRRIDAAIRGLSYGLNWSDNLQSAWISVSNAYETGSAPFNAYFESVTNEMSITGSDTGFIQLEITEE